MTVGALSAGGTGGAGLEPTTTETTPILQGRRHRNISGGVGRVPRAKTDPKRVLWCVR